LVTALPALLGVFFGQTFPFAWFWGFWLGGIAPLIVLAYFVIAEALFERTIGKELMGLRVARLDGKRVDLWSSLVRNVSKIAFILLVLDGSGSRDPWGWPAKIQRPLHWNHGRDHQHQQNHS